jgi:hypothetical protein
MDVGGASDAAAALQAAAQLLPQVQDGAVALAGAVAQLISRGAGQEAAAVAAVQSWSAKGGPDEALIEGGVPSALAYAIVRGRMAMKLVGQGLPPVRRGGAWVGRTPLPPAAVAPSPPPNTPHTPRPPPPYGYSRSCAACGASRRSGTRERSPRSSPGARHTQQPPGCGARKCPPPPSPPHVGVEQERKGGGQGGAAARSATAGVGDTPSCPRVAAPRDPSQLPFLPICPLRSPTYHTCTRTALGAGPSPPSPPPAPHVHPASRHTTRPPRAPRSGQVLVGALLEVAGSQGQPAALRVEAILACSEIVWVSELESGRGRGFGRRVKGFSPPRWAWRPPSRTQRSRG